MRNILKTIKQIWRMIGNKTLHIKLFLNIFENKITAKMIFRTTFKNILQT